jgi:dTDP-glucose pyrophosphorylase
MDYRARSLKYKYARYKELDMARKLAHKVQQKKDLNESFALTTDDNLALQEEIKASKDEWEDAKNNKEKIEIANARRWAVFYLDACV